MTENIEFLKEAFGNKGQIDNYAITEEMTHAAVREPRPDKSKVSYRVNRQEKKIDSKRVKKARREQRA